MRLVHIIRGSTAAEFAASLADAIRAGQLSAGAPLPAIRALAAALGSSPATVAAAYRALAGQGLVVSDGRRGTHVSHLARGQRPGGDAPAPLPEGVRNLADGNPDRELLPTLAAARRRIRPEPRLYGEGALEPALGEQIAADLERDGVERGEIVLASGAMEALDRLLGDNLEPGARVALEDPVFGAVQDVVLARGLRPVPVAIDDQGPRPEALERTLCRRGGVQALVVTPRAQNPSGAALSAPRAAELGRVLRAAPDLLVIEDDHAALIAGVKLAALHPGRRRWAHIRSLSKALNPDLRLAAVTGDPETTSRLRDRQVVGERWVSHILQDLAAALLGDSAVRGGIASAETSYAERRLALIAALQRHGIAAHGVSGYNVWVPVEEETASVQGLLAAGFAVRAGERFRMQSAPALRITAATLLPHEAERLAAALARLGGRGQCLA